MYVNYICICKDYYQMKRNKFRAKQLGLENAEKKIANSFDTSYHIVWFPLLLFTNICFTSFLVNRKSIKLKILCIMQLKYNKDGNIYRTKYFKLYKLKVHLHDKNLNKNESVLKKSCCCFQSLSGSNSL